MGTFPSPKSPRVIWLGLSGQTDILASLVQDLEQAFAPSGISSGKAEVYPAPDLGPGPFQPGTGGLGPVSPVGPLPDFTDFQVEHLVLYRSTLRPQGALYTPLAEDRPGRQLIEIRAERRRVASTSAGELVACSKKK